MLRFRPPAFARTIYCCHDIESVVGARARRGSIVARNCGYCAGLEEDGEALRLHVAANARRVGEAVRAVSSDEGIVRIALGNYLEAVAEFAAGGRRERIYAVLSECVSGGAAG